MMVQCMSARGIDDHAVTQVDFRVIGFGLEGLSQSPRAYGCAQLGPAFLAVATGVGHVASRLRWTKMLLSLQISGQQAVESVASRSLCLVFVVLLR